MKTNKYFRITTIFKERKENSQLKMVEYASSRNAWLKEDNCYLSNSYTIIKDINKFQCADFEIVENDNIISIIAITKYVILLTNTSCFSTILFDSFIQFCNVSYLFI